MEKMRLRWNRIQRLLTSRAINQKQLTVASVFTDNMVLQREIPVVIWGQANPGASVQIAFAGQKQSTMATDDGNWSLKLRPMEAIAKGQTLTIKSGSQLLSFTNVVVGEVWLCSGQSNMGWTLVVSTDATEHITNAVNSNIRFLSVPTIRSDKMEPSLSPCNWLPSRPGHAKNWSAVAYHFATELYQELQVPIGIIWASLGATKIQEWTSQEINAIHAYDIEEEWNDNQPSSLFNGMIAPLIPFTMRGVAWYQGEENHWGAGVYQTQQAALIEDWRERWGQGSFPFIYVQLANYGKTNTDPWSAWAELQEAQLKSLSHPNTAMAVAIDVGAADDIHPPRKQPVGQRLAIAALGKVYKRREQFSGPLFRDFQIEGDKLRLFFDHADGGLKTSDGEALRWFEIAEADPSSTNCARYVPAIAVIDGEAVIVSAAGITNPVSVRYAFNSNPEGCNLCNSAMLPASPFRTSKDWSVTPGNDMYRPVKQIPVAIYQRITVAPSGSVAITLDISNQSGASFGYEIIDSPTQGTVSGTAPNLVYQHHPNAKNEDKFTFRVCDSAHSSNIASIVIDVMATSPRL